MGESEKSVANFVPEGNPPKLSEALDELDFMVAGLPPDVAAKAARAARENRESKIPKLEPDKKAYRKEYEYLQSKQAKSNS